jgi:hypothetical protein
MDDKEKMLRSRFAELAPWHVNGTLPDAERRWVDEYVRAHPSAAAELEWYRSLQAKVRADVPDVSPEIGLDRLLERVRSEKRRTAERGARNALERVLAPVQEFVTSLFARPAYAYAAAALVVVQAGVIGTLIVEQQRTEQEYSEYRSIATVPAAGPLLRVSFRSDARETDIRHALIDVGGVLVGGPGQLGEYVVRVPADRMDVAAATLRANAAVEAVEISAPAPK